jgi:hypothetical protein
MSNGCLSKNSEQQSIIENSEGGLGVETGSVLRVKSEELRSLEGDEDILSLRERISGK